MQRAPRVPKTRGAVELKAWLDANHVSQQTFAERLDVHQTTISLWLELEPGRMTIGYATAIERETGIHPMAWCEATPRPRRGKAA